MRWTNTTEYTPLPTSTSDTTHQSAAERVESLGVRYRGTSTLDNSRTETSARSRRFRWALGGCGFVLVVLFSGAFIVPEERLPQRVSTAVGSSKEAFEAAKVKWGWSSEERLEEEIQALEEENGLEGVSTEFDEKLDATTQTAEDEEGENEAGTQPVNAVDAIDVLQCSDEVRTRMGEPSFWTVVKGSTLISGGYAIVPRDPLPSNFPSACLSQAVFSARLVAASDPFVSSPESEILYVLSAPALSDTLDSFDIRIPPELQLPKARYELQVTLEFGFFPGVVEGNCGESKKVCDENTMSGEEGEQLRYVGEKIEIGQDVALVDIDSPSELRLSPPLCTDLSTLEGYWSSLSYVPLSPSPCSLFMPSFPIPFSPSPTLEPSQKEPLWIHFVGDSNTRNMYSHLVSSFGNGHKINAPKVVDSQTHNGTLASFASRWKSGLIDDDSSPDYIITWSWWYQTVARQDSQASWEKNVEANRDDLVRLVDTNLADYLSYSQLGPSVLSRNPSLSLLAPKLRPHRTYLSLGSHSERLSSPGLTSSLDSLFSSSSGLSRSRRDGSNLRIFTTTFVNPTYIPLDRFPHQDLVRNNAFISSKNSLVRQRPECTESIQQGEEGGGGRIINVEALTRGIITERGEWMKPGRKKGSSPDAVHFRDEVYQEWVRLVWTDLVQGLVIEDEEVEARGGERRRENRWKKSRIEDWVEEDEEF